MSAGGAGLLVQRTGKIIQPVRIQAHKRHDVKVNKRLSTYPESNCALGSRVLSSEKVSPVADDSRIAHIGSLLPSPMCHTSDGDEGRAVIACSTRRWRLWPKLVPVVFRVARWPRRRRSFTRRSSRCSVRSTGSVARCGHQRPRSDSWPRPSYGDRDLFRVALLVAEHPVVLAGDGAGVAGSPGRSIWSDWPTADRSGSWRRGCTTANPGTLRSADVGHRHDVGGRPHGRPDLSRPAPARSGNLHRRLGADCWAPSRPASL